MPFIELNQLNNITGLKCNICKREVNNQIQTCLKCDKCEAYFHPQCAGIIGANIKKVKSAIFWNCNDCKTAACSSPTNTVTHNIDDLNIKIQLADIVKSISEIKSMFADLKSSQQYLSNSFDELRCEYKRVAEENLNLKKELKSINNLVNDKCKTINNLEMEIDFVKQEKIASNIIISNIPDNSLAADEICTNLLKFLDINYSTDNIINIQMKYSNKEKDNISKKEKKSFVIISFSNINIKQQIIMKKKERMIIFARQLGFTNAKDDHQIFIRDHLTKFQLNLLNEAHKIKYEHKLKYLWVKNSKIHLRKDDTSKIFFVKSMNDLEYIHSLFRDK